MGAGGGGALPKAGPHHETCEEPQQRRGENRKEPVVHERRESEVPRGSSEVVEHLLEEVTQRGGTHLAGRSLPENLGVRLHLAMLLEGVSFVQPESIAGRAIQARGNEDRGERKDQDPECGVDRTPRSSIKLGYAGLVQALGHSKRQGSR